MVHLPEFFICVYEDEVCNRDSEVGESIVSFVAGKPILPFTVLLIAAFAHTIEYKADEIAFHGKWLLNVGSDD
jgi:hypothetical protein